MHRSRISGPLLAKVCLAVAFCGYFMTLGAQPAHASPSCCFGQQIYWIPCGQGSVCGIVEVYGCQQGMTGYVPQAEYVLCPCNDYPFLSTPPTYVGCGGAAPKQAAVTRHPATSTVAYYVPNPSGGFKIAHGRK